MTVTKLLPLSPTFDLNGGLELKTTPTTKKFKKLNDHISDSFSADLLDIREHLGNGIYLMSNLDLGVCYEVEGIYDEPLTNEELTHKFGVFFQGIREIISGIPSHTNPQNTVAHVILSQRALSEPLIDPKDGGKNYQYRDSKEGNFLKEEESIIFSTLRPRKRRFLLALRYSPERKKESFNLKKLFQGIFVSDEEVESEVSQTLDLEMKDFLEALTRVENQLSVQFKPKRLMPESILGYYQNVLHGAIDSPIIPANTYMNEAVYSPDPKLHPSNDGYNLSNGKKLSSYHLQQYPEGFKLGPLRYFIDSLPVEDFDLVWVFSNGQKDYSNDLRAKEGWFGRTPKRAEEFKEFQSFKKNISSLKPQGVLSFRLLTYDDREDLESKIQGIALDFLNARMVKEKDIPHHSIATSLPLNCKTFENKIKCRFKRIRLENALAYLPLYSGPKANNGTRWHISRSMTPTRFDFFDGEGARFMVALGRTRAGKSVFCQLFELEFLERYPKGIIRKIEIKTSSQKLCDQMGGKVIRFSEEELKSDPYSPFALDNPDLDDIDSLHLIIKTAIVQKNPGISMTATHDEILKEALKLAYNTQAENLKNSLEMGTECDPHPIWPDIIAQMPTVCNNLEASGVKGVEEAREELARWSVNLYPTGQYGFLFSKHETRKRSKELERYLVYDLDGIHDPVLRQLASMMAYIKVCKDLAKLPRSVTKFVEIDEFGTLQIGEDEAQKVNEEQSRQIIKTAAKYNTVTVIIDNDVTTFTEKPAGITVWNNKTASAFLPLGSMYENAKRAWKDEFTEAEWQVIKSLEKQPQFRRSAAYIKSAHELHPWNGSLFIPLSPVMDALTTSSPSQTELYEKLRSEGLAEDSAVLHMAKNHPYGEGLEEK